ncbi:hypothetical protein Tco_0459553 [Tanacetum coccineum]
MNTTQAQQKALDDALVALVDRLEFRKCNMRLKTDIKPKKATFKVVMDALAPTPFYQAFLITADVPAIYMQELWVTVTVHKSSIRFTINKKKFSLDVKKKTAPASKGSRLKSSAKVAKTDKKKQPATMPKTKGLAVSGTNKGAGVRPEVPDVSKYDSGSDEESWTFSQDKEDADEETGVNDDSEETESDNDGDNLTHPNLSTYKADDQEEEEEKADDEEMSSDQRVLTPPEYELTEEEEEENKEGDDKDKEGEQEQDEEDDLYRDVNINLERSDAEMILISLKLLWDTGTDKLTLSNVPVSVTTETPSSDTTIPSPPIPVIQPLQQTPESTTTTTTILTTTLPDIPNFASLFRCLLNSGIVDNYLASKIKEIVDVAVQLQTNKLREEAQAENHEFLNQVDSTMKAIIKEQVQAQVSKIMPKIEKYVTESLEAEVLVRSTNQPQTSYVVADSLSKFELKKMLIEKMETNKSIDRSDVQKDLYKALVESYNSDKDIISSYGKSAQAEEHGQKVDDLEEHSHKEFNTGNDDVIPVRETLEDASQWNPPSSPIPDREWHKTKTIDKRPPQPWISQLAQAIGTQSSFNDVVELEYHLEEVFKATNDRLDWHNPEGKPYPHDLSKPLPLIQNERGRQVIPWDYFINNDLKYLKGGSSSQKYTTSITKTKATEYGQVKWIEDKVSRIWSQVKVVYDKHAY